MLWKVYFWVMIIILAIYHASVGLPRVWEVIDLAHSIIVIIGLFGFCWERKIFTRLFWRVFLAVTIIWMLLYQYYIPEVQTVHVAPTPEWFSIFDKVFSLAINILLLVALFLYGFKRSGLWED